MFERDNQRALLVCRPQRRAPAALTIARDLDLPRLTTHRAVLHEGLPASARLIDVQLHGLSAVGTALWERFRHLALIGIGSGTALVAPVVAGVLSQPPASGAPSGRCGEGATEGQLRHIPMEVCPPASMTRLRSVLSATIAVFAFSMAQTAWCCSCGGTSVQEMFGRADAVVEGQVVDVDRGYLRLAWCAVRGFFGSDLDDYDDACGVRVTLAVSRRWKGQEAPSVRIATGRGGGDCGVPFQKGQSWLLYLHAIRPRLFGTNICMRPQLSADAADDRQVLISVTDREAAH